MLFVVQLLLLLQFIGVVIASSSSSPSIDMRMIHDGYSSGSTYCFATGAFSTYTKARLQKKYQPYDTPKQHIRPFTSTSTTTTRTSQLYSNVDKGFNLLEVASKIVPQGRIVQTAKESWKFAWKRMMTELAPQDKTGSYQRPTYTFSSSIGNDKFPIESGRYHIYVGNPCPWCHRIRLLVEILGLEKHGIIDMTVLQDDPVKASRGGWVLPTMTTKSSSLGNKIVKQQNIQDLRGLYDYLNPNYKGRCTAPLIVDWKNKEIVSNESKDMVRFLPKLARLLTNDNDDITTTNSMVTAESLVPSELESTIDVTNEWIYKLLNNGVYRCGFSTTQQAYEVASNDVRIGLQRCNEILSKQRYVCSDTTFTESDILLLPTLLRFDGVYSPFFKAGGYNSIRLQCDYPYIYKYMKHCWQNIPGVSSSIDISDACSSYYKQLFPLNPGGIIPSPMVTSQWLGLDD